MSILHNCHVFVDTYLPMMNSTVLANMGQHVSAAIPLTPISILQVLRLALLYNPHLELSEQGKRGVTHQVFCQWNKCCEKMEIWLPRKWTVL